MRSFTVEKITRKKGSMSKNLRKTFTLAEALIGRLLIEGPTWHSKMASSASEALVICKLNSPLSSVPNTEYRGKPGNLLS